MSPYITTSLAVLAGIALGIAGIKIMKHYEKTDPKPDQRQELSPED